MVVLTAHARLCISFSLMVIMLLARAKGVAPLTKVHASIF